MILHVGGISFLCSHKIILNKLGDPLEEMKKHKMTFEQVVKNLTWKRDIYPMWIDIYFDDEKTVYVYFSRRFRKYSEICMKKDRDIPPFKRIYNKFEIE